MAIFSDISLSRLRRAGKFYLWCKDLAHNCRSTFPPKKKGKPHRRPWPWTWKSRNPIVTHTISKGLYLAGLDLEVLPFSLPTLLPVVRFLDLRDNRSNSLHKMANDWTVDSHSVQETVAQQQFQVDQPSKIPCLPPHYWGETLIYWLSTISYLSRG